MPLLLIPTGTNTHVSFEVIMSQPLTSNVRQLIPDFVQNSIVQKWHLTIRTRVCLCSAVLCQRSASVPAHLGCWTCNSDNNSMEVIAQQTDRRNLHMKISNSGNLAFLKQHHSSKLRAEFTQVKPRPSYMFFNAINHLFPKETIFSHPSKAVCHD